MNTLLLNVLDRVNIGTIVVDEELNILLWNMEMERVSKVSKKKALHKPIAEICPVFQEKMYMDYIHNAMRKGQSRFCSSVLHRVFILPEGEDKFNKNIRQNMRIEPIFTEERSYVLIQIMDITHYFDNEMKMMNLVKDLENAYTEAKESEEATRSLAQKDPLTGLLNRSAFEADACKAINQAGLIKEKLAVLFLDLDGFKSINDSFGHEFGDALLQEVAGRMKQRLRREDIAARLGGDEFVVVLRNIRNRETVASIALKLLEEIRQPYVVRDQVIQMSASIGISLYPEDGNQIEVLIRKADKTMYVIKRAGKNAYAFYEEF